MEPLRRDVGAAGRRSARGESALAGALRETNEETGIEVAALRPRFAVRLDLDVWSYTTVAADAPAALPVAVSDRESTALEWVPADRVADRELHPGFGAAWPRLRAALLDPAPVLVVDVANVMGSRPDGWWKDRAGAARRLLASLSALAAAGIPEEAEPEPVPEPLPVVRRWPRVIAVVEGEARAAEDVSGVEVVRAGGSGDDEVVAQAALAGSGPVAVVTADRGLADRVRAAGASVLGPRRLLDLL
ncbi:NUDIX domain-containing protein [Amnibacterium kyonggiense]